MKNFVFLFLALLIAFPVSAEIRRADAERKVLVSEGSQLMTQVDIVSLYLTSDKVAYEPRMTSDHRIHVDVTILSKKFREDKRAMRDFVSRQIGIFKREVALRVGAAAPSIAARFDPDQDIIFDINEGARRSPVATVDGRGWSWAGGSEPAKSYAAASAPKSYDSDAVEQSEGLNEARAMNSDAGEWCNCPSLIRRK